MSAQRTYPTVARHDDVRCPQCGRPLKGEGRSHGQLADAKWAKHCGAPCYGTAWYNLDPSKAPERDWAQWGNSIAITPHITPFIAEVLGNDLLPVMRKWAEGRGRTPADAIAVPTIKFRRFLK